MGKSGKRAPVAAATNKTPLPSSGAAAWVRGGAHGHSPEKSVVKTKKKSKYDFSKYKHNTGDAVRTLMANAPTSNVPAKTTVFGGILAVLQINPNKSGWYKGLDAGLALKKAMNMTSFPMNGNPGQTKEFGHYGIFEDPHDAFSQDPGGMLDKSSLQTVQDLAQVRMADMFRPIVLSVKCLTLYACACAGLWGCRD